jgi:hypothetical protein
MGVFKVVEDWAGGNGGVDIDPNTLRPAGSFNRGFDVYFTEDDTSYKPISALTAVGPDGTRIPQPWEPIDPSNPWVYVVGYSPSMSEGTGPFMVRVTVKYKIFEDPLAVPPNIRWDFSRESDELHKAIRVKTSPIGGGCIRVEDQFAAEITNSAGETPESPMMKDYNDLLMIVTVNRASFDELKASDYMDAVNSDIFRGWKPGYVRCKRYNGTPMRAGALEYWQHNYELQIRTFASDPLNVGFLRRFLDQGYKEYYQLPSGVWDKKAITTRVFDKDANGTELLTFKDVPVSKPVNLNTEGQQLESKLPGMFLEWRDYDLLPFSHFGLG